MIPPRLRFLALSLAAAAGCAKDTPAEPGVGGPPAFGIAGGEAQAGFAGIRLPDSIAVRVVDPNGRGVNHVPVRFTATNGVVSPGTTWTDAQGYARAAWVLGAVGAQRASASIAGMPAVPFTATAQPVEPPAAAEMLRALDGEIRNARLFLQDGAPRNPSLATWYDAKTALVTRASLFGDILRGRQWIADSVRSVDGRMLHVVAVYAIDTIHPAAMRAMQEVIASLPHLEAITATPYPHDHLWIWDGFQVGSWGGGGELHLEDEGTYLARRANDASPNPYISVVPHEAAHSYIPHESLTQFLELYAYNVSRIGSTDPTRWAWTRKWVPGAPTEGVHILLDVYQLMGRDAMARAYRAMATMRPLSGVPLSAAAKQAFIDAAPAAVRDQVAAKLANLTT
ncbi:MAG TPA: Ig-like domain-containing protein [Gemmatimonadaceae bacterium]